MHVGESWRRWQQRPRRNTHALWQRWRLLVPALVPLQRPECSRASATPCSDEAAGCTRTTQWLGQSWRHRACGGHVEAVGLVEKLSATKIPFARVSCYVGLHAAPSNNFLMVPWCCSGSAHTPRSDPDGGSLMCGPYARWWPLATATVSWGG
jgi:hypothetical protein